VGFGGAELLGWTDDRLAAIAETRGWTEDAIERLELHALDDDRVGIPIRDEALESYGELRYDPTGLRKPKVKAPAGAPRQLFPPPEAIADGELGDRRRIWLVEGEPDAIRLWSIGIPAVAVPGGQNWNDRWAARFTGRHLEVVVCFDCDRAGRTGAAQAATAIARAGVTARLVELDPDRDDGYDLTDYAAAATTADDRQQVAQLLEAIADRTPTFEPPPAPATPDDQRSTDHGSTTDAIVGERPWRSVTWSTFRDISPPAHKWLVDGLLPAGALCFVAGPPKRGKTWIGIGLSIALALGQPFAGEHEIPQPRDVLYVALEGSQTGLRTRIGALARGYGADPDTGDLDRLHMLYRPRPFDLAELAGAQWLVDEADELDASLVVVDVLRAAARFDENAAADFAKIRDRLDPLLALERTVALMHHFGKPTDTQQLRSPGERMAGTGAMYGALDIGLLITKSENGARRLRVDVEARDFAAPDALGRAIEGDGTGKHGGFTYADTATLVIDETAAADRDLAAEAEALFADGEWRTPVEIADHKKGGIGINLDVLRATLEPLWTATDPDAETRFVRLASGAAVGRSKNAHPVGTWAMYAAIAPPRPVRLGSDLGSESDPAQLPLGPTHGSDSPPMEGESVESDPRGSDLGTDP
jgi:hypothetical protein